MEECRGIARRQGGQGGKTVDEGMESGGREEGRGRKKGTGRRSVGWRGGGEE